MTAYPEEKRTQFKLTLKRALIREPALTIAQTMELLKISQQYAVDLLKEVRTEYNEEMKAEIEKMKAETVEEALQGLDREFAEIVRELWRIITDKDSTHKNKVAAARALTETRAKIMNWKFDAGLFKKSLGEANFTMSDLVKLMKDEKPHTRTNQNTEKIDQ